MLFYRFDGSHLHSSKHSSKLTFFCCVTLCTLEFWFLLSDCKRLDIVSHEWFDSSRLFTDGVSFSLTYVAIGRLHFSFFFSCRATGKWSAPHGSRAHRKPPPFVLPFLRLGHASTLCFD